MTFRAYILPRVVAVGEGPRGRDIIRPAHVELFPNTNWGMTDYGGGEALLYIDLDTTQQATLAAFSDTIQLPIDLDATLTAGQVTGAQAYLDSIQVPSDWVNTSRTVRDMIRGIAGVFLFAQRFGGRSGSDNIFNVLPRDLDRTFNSYPADIRARLQATAADLRIDVSSLTGTSTLRDFLRVAGQTWLSRPYTSADQVI